MAHSREDYFSSAALPDMHGTRYWQEETRNIRNILKTSNQPNAGEKMFL